ncbi:hypothetical protein TrRE_jg4318 [Triparma retinervis]|uniref:Amino acid transporter transmembrane domain-containing protein n=1 Tax=Triparma retinervis TaxID=2557542 RepID=A0A9W7AQ60_9STRA|nr:hypothetical protein TrRE_jg4318 [Triparma retinervis]
MGTGFSSLMLPKLADMNTDMNSDVQNGKPKKVGTYTEIGAVYDVVNGSRFGERTVNWSILMQQLSVCTVYFSFVSTNIASLDVVENMHELDRRTAEIIVMCIMYFPCVIMVCRSESMNDFKLVSKFCNLLLALCFLSVVVVGELGWVVANESSGGKVADSGAVLKTALAFSTVLYSFEGVCLVLPIYASHPRNSGKMSFSVTYVLALTTVVSVYLAFGLWCKWKFGNVTDGSVTAFISDNVVPDKNLAGSLAGSLSSLILPGVMWGGIKGWTTTMAVVVGVGVCVGAGGATASIVEIVREGLK